LPRDVHSKPAFARQLEGEIDFVEVHRLLAGVRLHQHPSNRLGVLGGENLVPQLDEVSVEAVQRQVAHLEVDVRRTLFDSQPQEAVQLFPFHRSTPSARMVRPIHSEDSEVSIGV
jgi:hypothetical protein